MGFFDKYLDFIDPLDTFGRNGGGGDSGGGGGGASMNFPQSLLSQGQEQDVISRLLKFNDTPDKPLGTASRQALLDRIGPDFIPQFFRNDTLNPFLNAQFRLGREQLSRDTTDAEARFQRLGAYFTPDMPDFMGRLQERTNLNEQDFLANLGFRGAEVSENLRTDAIAKALGLESVTAGVMDALLGRATQRIGAQAGFAQGLGLEAGPSNGLAEGLGLGLGSIFGGGITGTGEGTGSGGGSDFSDMLTQIAFQVFKSQMMPGGGVPPTVGGF